MKLTRHEHAAEFVEHAGEFLAEREAEHNLMLGLAANLRREPRMFGGEPYFAVIEDESRVVGATLRTPPHDLVLSEMDDDRALEPLVEDVRDVFGTLPGVVGPKEWVKQFVSAWELATGQKGRRTLAQRIFRVDAVEQPQGVPGAMRPYEERDRELVIRWMDAFAEEALPHLPPESSEAFIDRRQADPEGGLVIWEDREAVSFAGYGGPTPNGIRIGPVYTPPELRRRGYASALTAALTQQLLDRGRRFCFLFTDLANPTSNSIYQRIGYRGVSDVDQWAFD